MKFTSAEKVHRFSALYAFILVTILSIIFLFLSITLFKQEIPENYVETEATVTTIIENEIIDTTSEVQTTSYEYEVYIDYTFNNQTFTDKPYGKYDSSMKENETKVKIFVDPDDPETFMTDASDNVIFLLISAVFFVIGVAGIVINVKNKRSAQ